jgi:ABC-type glycerol-3-phosphate transport system substrate-binding protein
MPSSDFYPAVWEAYQWDGGFWAVPALAAPLVLIYKPEAFDAAGLAYPTENWTMDDIAEAARALATSDLAGLHVSEKDLAAFFSILSGQSLSTSDVMTQPNFATPEVAQLLETWSGLTQEQAATSLYSPDIPLKFAHITLLDDSDFQGTLLNGQAALDVSAFAISRGTQQPELAYQLAVYLSNAPELRGFYASALPARRSLAETFPEAYQESLPESALALREEALENAIAPSMFAHYLPFALNNSAAPLVALQDAQAQAEQSLATAEAMRESVQLTVAPVLAPTLAPSNEVLVDFALLGSGGGFRDRALWETAIEEFLANNSDIDAIKLTYVEPVQGYWDEIPRHECISRYDYRAFENNELLALDPLLQADPDFDPEDVIGDVLLEGQRDAATYAIPYSISPMMMRYDRALFAEAGLPEPDGSWTVSEFVDSLRHLAEFTDGAPLWPNVNDASFWEMLMVAYGAVPIDYSTEPPSLHLADEAVIPVVQQVLDLGKSGLIDYQVMTTFFGYGQLLDYRPALIADYLRLETFNPETTGFVSFPEGIEQSPVSFYTESSFIFADAQYPEACYRWLREITRHPELYRAMPAYHSLLDTPSTQVLFGETGVAAFQRIAAMLEAPNRVLVRNMMVDELFVTRAYDRYVLEDADLATELQNAVVLTEAYWHCMETSEGDIFACLLEADPSIREVIEEYLPPDY